ncbi:MAG: ABC transporter substrate-binding protein [Gemmatales bacterium]|nr:ABC transporter substrate-binding protein [Gemmatales bacterium]MDW7994741.1 ABC transporter substrate-binding protein [Gemmatales bacterium]
MARNERWLVKWFAVTLLLCGGCGDQTTAPQVLVFISPHRDEIRYEAEQGFRRWLRQQSGWEQTEVQFVWRDIGGGTSQIIRYLDAQYQLNPASCGIDIFWGGGTDVYIDLKRKGLLEHCPLPEDVLAFLGPGDVMGIELRDPEGYWYGSMLTTLGIFYHEGVLQRLGIHDWQPKRWWDLTDERLAGHISAGDPRMSGSVHLLYEWLLQVYGWDKGMELLLRLAANARSFARSSDSVSRDVVLGKAACAGTLDFFALTAMAREQEQVRRGWARETQLRLVFPPGETILNPDSIAILKGAPHYELARMFVIWCLSEVGQQTWMLEPLPEQSESPIDPEPTHARSSSHIDSEHLRQRFPGAPRRYRICRLSVAERLYDPERYPLEVRSVHINPFEMVRRTEPGNLRRYDNRLAESRRRALDDLLGAWMLDTHGDLRAAWDAVRRLPPAERTALEQQLFAPPCSEQELMEARAALSDPRQRIRLVADWIEKAQQRYRTIQTLAEARFRFH